MLSQFFRERTATMNIIYAEYNIHHNSIDIATTAEYLLLIYLKYQNQSKHNIIPLVTRLCIPMTGWYSQCEMVQRSRQKFKIQQNRKGIFRFMCYSKYVVKNNKKG